MKKLPSLVLLCALSLFYADSARAQQSNQGQMPAEAIASGGPVAAQAAVDVWLSIVDDGRYAQGWDAASSLFKKAVPQAQWTTLATGHRAPLGKMLSRRMISANFSRQLPGTPPGQYVVVVYAASFEHKKTAVETATAMLDVDGQWRVTGYMVK